MLQGLVEWIPSLLVACLKPLPPPPQVHAHIISYLKQEMPSVFRKDNKKKNLIYQLPVIFSKIQLQHNISAGDFPDCAKMQVCLHFLS